jgi:hypothetical protein
MRLSLASLALSLSIASFSVGAQPAAEASHAPTDTVTVQARRERKELERQVSHFVAAVSVRYLNDALSRWNRPICPLVAGLPREQGEFVLARLSQIARQAKAPLAAEHCKKGNFYVVVTREPDALLKAWHARDPNMYMTRNGGGYIRNFLDTPRPVRVWYNTDFVSSEGVALSANVVAAALAGTSLGMQLTMSNIPTTTIPTGTRLRRSLVQSLSSVIVVVDGNRVQNLQLGQLADYMGMVGLAEVNLDADVGSAPSIMKLFRDVPDPPQGLSSFDQAFLSSLYRAEQASVMQESAMKTIMLESISPQHTNR